MSLLAEYAITPDVFDTTSYSNEEVCGLHLHTIREVMMNEGLVRDLRAGQWRELFAKNSRPWHRRAREIVRKLVTQSRLIEFPAVLSPVPTNDQGWCAEVLAGHQQNALAGGVIVTQTVKNAYPREPLVERIDRLSGAGWWTNRSPSVRLDRKIDDYRQQLGPILRCANSLQFIDPHLYPGQRGYRNLADLITCAGRRSPAPLIEFHRVCYEGWGPNMQILDYGELERIFRSALATRLQAVGLSARVFIWDDFHDRYLISNLIGISLPNGFDTTNRPNDMTTWTRLGRTHRDEIQREFEEASRRHVLRHEFTIP